LNGENPKGLSHSISAPSCHQRLGEKNTCILIAVNHLIVLTSGLYTRTFVFLCNLLNSMKSLA